MHGLVLLDTSGVPVRPAIVWLDPRTPREPGIPVATGGGDLAMGAIGSGVIDEGVDACTIGTGGQAVTTVRDAVIDPHGRLHTLCYPVAGRWFLMGATLAAGLSLRWFRDALSGVGVAAARRPPPRPYDG